MFSDRSGRLVRTTSRNVQAMHRQLAQFVEQGSLTFSFRNETRFTIVVATRQGLRFTIPPVIQGVGREVGYFLVLVKTVMHLDVKTDVDDLFIVDKNEPSKEARVWKQELTGTDVTGLTVGVNAAYGQNYRHGVLHSIHESELEEVGGSVYNAGLDLLLAISVGRRPPPPHPYSRAGSVYQVNQQVANFDETLASSFSVRIVDRDSRFGNRFINNSGIVQCIGSERNPPDEVDDGVYLTVSQSLIAGMGEQRLTTKYYSFEDVDKHLALYMTHAEAVTLGQPSDVYKRQLEEQAYQLQSEKNRFAEEQLASKRRQQQDEERMVESKRLHEVEMRRRSETLERMKIDAEERENRWRQEEYRFRTEQVIVKNRLDEKSDFRKVMLETLKFIPAIIGAMVTVVVAVGKLKESSNK